MPEDTILVEPSEVDQGLIDGGAYVNLVTDEVVLMDTAKKNEGTVISCHYDHGYSRFMFNLLKCGGWKNPSYCHFSDADNGVLVVTIMPSSLYEELFQSTGKKVWGIPHLFNT